jgi:IS5 family transposase
MVVQLPFVSPTICHVHARELQQIGRILDQMPELAQLVYADLVASGVSPKKGREGMSGEQVLRTLVVKQMNGFDYEELAFHLADSATYRAFCYLGFAGNSPKKATLQRNFKLVRAETLEAINRLLLSRANEHDVENGHKVRVDSTVEDSAIHPPTDSSLLYDSVRVLARLMIQSKALLSSIVFTDHTRRAKRRDIAILHAKSIEDRVPLYRDLLKVSNKTLGAADRAADQIDAFGRDDKSDSFLVGQLVLLAVQIRHYIALARRVVDQTKRRILDGESVPAAQKLVSIFEPHADVIVKDRRATYYGHKLFLTTGASGLILDCVVEDGNPADATLAIKMIERQKEFYDRAPRQAAFDGGFSSRENLAAIKEMGVEDIAFSKARGLEIGEMASSGLVYRQLRRFRAGVEAGISFLKRCFGISRCNWRGLPSFKAYTWSGIVSANLLQLARLAFP